MAAAALLLLLALPAGAWPGLRLPCWLCMHCSCLLWPPLPSPHARMSDRDEWVGLPHMPPTINISILKGEKGEAGVRGRSSRSRKEGPPGSRGLCGHKGQKGQVGPPGTLCQRAYVAFSVGRREGLHSTDALQAVPFDTELVNLDGAFDLASSHFLCAVPGVYFLSLNVHTWNYKVTYLHIMCNRQAVLYAQPSERRMMQTQSLLLALATGDAVWVSMFQRDGDNAIYSERGDLYITFSGHLVKPDAEL
ncbi:LOW QUALITY PROTEIN: complement C1q tumor necrosis factor-related protein 8 [Physeter macrocephalus]|uniref:LOW QUALITY PROTEIN: complement C1q tumor necrosis factor-related protein 8 n=1 Tax=Physeter macrocephalus TaxID=9755 RepID=A0A2Y9ED21_PHYMC|nr:LOW QUALITY PROTEIN: complement C1q tumor necrosis factor-related protein 8 [Physeter catodon]|eukprot:XP_007100192.3 LOW QUALITY PROTEIN: complement C1q tumor necrosis factor-related protein 8 [Physeter catodon]